MYSADGKTFTINDSVGTGKITSTNYGILTWCSANVILNGGTVESDVYGVYLYGGSTFTLDNGTISTKKSGAYGVVLSQATGSTTDYSAKNGTPNNFIMNGGNIEVKYEDDGTSDINAVYVEQNNNFTMNNGTISSTGIKSDDAQVWAYGVYVFANSTFKMNGGSINTDTAFGVVSQGTIDKSSYSYGANSKIEINGGSITSTKDLGIYNPATNSELTINGGNITGTSGIEIRAGELTVTGGTITGTGEANSSGTPDGGGSTSSGAGISISPYASRNINVTIGNAEGGDTGTINISGANALALGNAEATQANSIDVAINNGNLTSESGNAIYADDAKANITVNGGTLAGNVTVTKKAAATTATAKITVNNATVTGDINVETDSTTKEKAIDSLEIKGGTYTNAQTVSKLQEYTNENLETATDANGNVVVVNKTIGWTQKGLEGTTTWQYLIGTDESSSVVASVTGVNSYASLKANSINGLLGVASVNGVGWGWGTANENYAFAKFSTTSGAMTIAPQSTGVRVIGTGFIGNVTTLKTDGGTTSIGAYVDATNNNLTSIEGGDGPDTLKAGAKDITLNGGNGNDILEGDNGVDTFIYTAGKDEINNYTHGTDIVSVTSDLTPSVDLNNVNFNGTNLVVSLSGDDNALTFRSVADVAIFKGNATYSYQGNTGGSMNYVAFNSATEHGISLGAGYSGRFNGTLAANEDYKTIDASHVNNAIRVTGNDNNNYMVASKGGGTLEGVEGKDILNGAGTTASLVLNGGDDDDSLIGGTGKNVFFYTGGADSISGYHDNDLITVRGGNIDIANAAFNAEGNNISLDFGGEDRLIFENISGVTNGVSIQSGSSSKNIYVYKKDSIARDKSITLTSGFADSIFSAGTYDTVNAVNASKAVSISGNDNNNVIFGSKQGGTLFGGAGKDKLDVTERGDGKNFVFKYTEGKDTVSGFVAGDKLEITADKIDEITKAKSSKSNTRLAFTFDKSNVLTFNSDGDEISRVSLNDGGFLTKDGVVKGTNFKLFASARGKIDLTEAPYVGAGIASINAADVKKQSVTLIGASVDGGSSYTFAEKNKKKDQFEYNGGNVSISGYEAGVDRLDLNTAALGTFSVEADGGDVSLSAGDNVVVLKNMQGQEVLLHHADSKRNSFTKMVFKQEGVILNKEKRPTMATVSASYDASGDSTVKKIFVADGTTSNLAITAGDRNKTTLDASAAASGKISLIGGAKNDKLIGNTSTVVSDTFIYTGGKDIIQNYGSNDHISLGSFASSLTSAKINAGKRSIKFKFSNKNALTIKPAKGSTLGDALVISDIPPYTYSKNAIASSSNVSLTSEFSGSYRLKNSNANNVDGHLVEKNLTFRGTSSDETLAGGTKKTTFKGGGGSDSLKGGSGNDVFFYAKGDSGNATIADFDFNKDKLKIASGTITNISTVSGGIKFDMNNGKKNSANIGSFTVANSLGGGDIDTTKTLIKTNNTYYWFAQDADTTRDIKVGDLITADTKVSKSNATATGYAIIDLGYSSNLVKADVATKAGEFTFDGGITKKTTNNG